MGIVPSVKVRSSGELRLSFFAENIINGIK